MYLLEYAIRLNRTFMNEYIDIPPIFWKYYDLYRRGKIDLLQFAELSDISERTLNIYLKCV